MFRFFLDLGLYAYFLALCEANDFRTIVDESQTVSKGDVVAVFAVRHDVGQKLDFHAATETDVMCQWPSL